MKTHVKRAAAVFTLLLVAIAGKTYHDVKTPSLGIKGVVADSERFTVLDRNGEPLGITYQNRFNTMSVQPLHEVPRLLREALVTAEDRRFFSHNGVDWQARFGALWQDLGALRIYRGASTITEQVVRIVHPRPRSLWSRWIEGFEAMLLERKASKAQILEFYLNQVPYAANRRGVAQAARYYFDRDLKTLTEKEMLALAVLPRAPSALDLYKKQKKIEPAIGRLAAAMTARGELVAEKAAAIRQQQFALSPPSPPVSATHFINFIRQTVPYRLSDNGMMMTTLDGDLQHTAQTLLDERIKGLERKRVHNGAMLVVDHTTGEILVWAVAGAASKNLASGSAIDAVRTPRQPGSSLKPFLYATALDLGWSPATQLDDEPMTEAIGTGLHDFKNYSHTFYGKISLREALGNSLNIPALETVAFVTPQRYLEKLHALGFQSLTRPAEFYKDGLALGNGEVTLYEMVQGFSTLANKGVFRPLTPLRQASYARQSQSVYSEEASSLIANILSDPFARRREFGINSVLNLPTQTAVKTGTSTDYRDAWVLGFDARYTVGVWFGNLDQAPMDGVTGSTGPALVLRAMFSELSMRQTPKPLYLSPKLAALEVCTDYDRALTNNCFPRTEYFIPGTEASQEKPEQKPTGINLLRPTEGLQIAYDPRIPSDVQAFEFVADGVSPGGKVEWVLNGERLRATETDRLLWPVKRGSHTLLAQERSGQGQVGSAVIVHFVVK